MGLPYAIQSDISQAKRGRVPAPVARTLGSVVWQLCASPSLHGTATGTAGTFCCNRIMVIRNIEP